MAAHNSGQASEVVCQCIGVMLLELNSTDEYDLQQLLFIYVQLFEHLLYTMRTTAGECEWSSIKYTNLWYFLDGRDKQFSLCVKRFSEIIEQTLTGV
jgi:hypothetical protein